MTAWKGSKNHGRIQLHIVYCTYTAFDQNSRTCNKRKMKLPQVVGALLAGVILGPAVLNVVKETEFISELSEIGVIVLMFTAGLTTDVKELKRTGKSVIHNRSSWCYRTTVRRTWTCRCNGRRQRAISSPAHHSCSTSS